jgi:outer membrane lipoprotein SlyB
MKTMNKFATVLGAVGVLSLGACATTGDPYGNSTSSSGTSYPQNQQTQYPQNSNSGYGVVQSIDLVQQGNPGTTGIGGTSIGVGTIAGAVIGGVLGHQVGSGTGQTVATVAGAAGGAYVGNQVDKSRQQRTADVYRFTIRMDNGDYQTLTQSTDSGFRVGDRVRIDNGYLSRG